MKKHQKISGKIQYVSFSPHGDPEGVVLEDGTFVRIPPHSLLKKKSIAVGALVEGSGELLIDEPNDVFHHAKLMVDDELVCDDSMDKKERENRKEKHKKDLESREDAPAKDIRFKGKLVAIGAKPKGEIDRLIFDDGTSVHLGKDIDLAAEDVSLGDSFEVTGLSRMYGKNRFVKAETVKQI